MATKILVVDDEPKLVENVRAYLEAASYTVVSAANGREALAVFHSERPDLVLLDLRLPELHGMDVARAIRAHSSVPILMLTAQADDVDKIAGLEAGADDYVTKPFNPRELVARVRAVLRRAEASANSQEQARVFISSVMKGYEQERQAVRDAIEALETSGVAARPVMAEQFSANPDPPRELIFRELDASDAYVGILGRRYGYVNPQTDLSATEEEYRRARDARMPMLLFVQRLPPEQTRETRQEEFVRRVMDYSAGHYIATFENPDQLRFEAHRALAKLLRASAA